MPLIPRDIKVLGIACCELVMDALVRAWQWLAADPRRRRPDELVWQVVGRQGRGAPSSTSTAEGWKP